MILKPITSAFDVRLMGLMKIALMPDAFESWILEKYAWVRSYSDQGRMDLFIARAQIELPLPIEVWAEMSYRSIEGLNNQALIAAIARGSGVTSKEFKRYSGIKSVDNSSYPHHCAITMVGIQLQQERPVIESWRKYKAAADRRVAEDEDS